MCTTNTCSTLYWTESGTVARIKKASMDGSGEITIHNTEIQRPYSLVIDIETQMLYWADHTLDKIETSTVNGTGRRTVTTLGVSQPFSLSLLGNNLYYSDWIFGVRSVNRFNGETPTTIFNNFCDYISAYGLQVISLQRQPQGFSCSTTFIHY